ncbi:YopX family protein [Rossellomorea marisflavi]|uniref:YopX family protein n=1 Tax=Rossellomorea marisflavi TaxID=189381 RepID=UPI003F9F9717
MEYKAWHKKEKRMIQWNEFVNISDLYPFRLSEVPLSTETKEHEDLVYLQYTGVEDCSGEKIFEGDILESEWGYRFEVFFSDGAFKTDSEDFEYVNSQNVTNYKLKVAGNVQAGDDI